MKTQDAVFADFIESGRQLVRQTSGYVMFMLFFNFIWKCGTEIVPLLVSSGQCPGVQEELDLVRGVFTAVTSPGLKGISDSLMLD
jgi:hypothetical protein